MTATTPQFPEISGYTITEQLYLGSRTAVYRAVHNNQQIPVVIKVLQREYPTFGELVQFRNQYAIAKNLPIAGIVQPLSLETLGNGYALVMTDWGGISLEKYIQQQQLDLTEKLAIALQLADILHELHSSRVIHKDIKPANILIHPESKQVKLIDFSIASLLPKETQEIQNPNVLEGTLAYLAPEQTGRMNRGIDYRSDFYAFGVTLYQLLSVSLPFITDDPLELVHCHIAQIATPIYQVNTDVPKILGAIVAKLMAKNAEERYQSALGLKHDLAECLSQWKETGSITEFDLAQRDLCDRFIIPEKLYGREAEVQALLEAFHRVAVGASELMLVAGFSGIGKTAVVNEVHKPITRQRGYFIKGKFDQFNRNIPFSGFVQAFRSLMGQLLSESDTELQGWKAKILEAVGENGQLLIEVIPELEHIIGSQPPVAELSGSAAQNRFNLLLQKFIAVFTTPDHPLVMFLDDLQWADSASLNLLNLLMADSKTGYLLVLGAYRDNEVFPAHPLMFTLEDIKKRCHPTDVSDPKETRTPLGGSLDLKEVCKRRAPREHQLQIYTLTLKPLTQGHIHHLVADTLLCATELAAPLAALVYQKTQGNPFFATQFLQGLYEEDCITFDRTVDYWQCDLTQVRQLALTDDVVEFMVMRLRKLPEATQEVLQLAACMGNRFELDTLALVCEKSQDEVATDLWQSLQDGLMIPQSQTYKFFQGNSQTLGTEKPITVGYRFLHDRVQQAAYSLIPETQKQKTHLKIGRLLLHNTPAQEQESRIFAIVNQYNQGLTLVNDPQEKEKLSRLNLIAAQKARSSTAYQAAAEYCDCGIKLLDNSWQDYYQLTLELHNLAAESAYLKGDFAQMEQWIGVLLEHSRTVLDCIKAYEVKIEAYKAQDRRLEAVHTGLAILGQLGVHFPHHPRFIHIGLGLGKIKLALIGKKIPDLINLPVMTQPDKLAAMGILIKMYPAAYFAAPQLFPLLVFKGVNLSLKYGNIPESSIAYVAYAVSLCGIVGNIESGYEFGQLSLRLLERFDAKSTDCTTLYAFSVFVQHWLKPLRESLNLFLQAYQSGLETGDLEQAAFSLRGYGYYSFCSGKELSSLREEMMTYRKAIIQLKQETVLSGQELFIQVIDNLLGESQQPCELNGNIYHEHTRLPLHEKTGDKGTLCLLYLQKSILYYLFQDYARSLEYLKLAQPYLDSLTARIDIVLFYFYGALTRLALTNCATKPEQKQHLQWVATAHKKLNQWVRYIPENHQHKADLIQAELYRVSRNIPKAMQMYDRAIAGAKANEYLQEEALANELAGKFYLDWDKEKVAASYIQEAYYCYSRWGAKAKIHDLERCYPSLLRPILQLAEVSTGTWNTLMTISPLTASVHSGTHKSSSSTSINQVLDFAAILKASQTLSSTIELDQLLHQLTQIILQNSGGDRCALILPNETEEWQVRAMATLDNTQLCAQPLANNPNLPVKFIQYVKNTQETVVINELKTDLPVIDDYLLQRQPKSLLCLPLLNQGQLIGILYLKNRLTIGAFTSDRVEVLNFLCTQAVISLENARLYQQAQAYAQQLEEFQLQVVQSEKMASLGNLVAGVAHEINNPIGFLNGSIKNAKDYTQDLLHYLETYHQQQPPNAEVEELAQDIDLEYLLEDLPKLIDSMQGATDRIKSISTSLRTFSRADTDHKVSINLHEGLDSTLLILKYRLKANDCRPEIQITKDYGDLPKIECFPGQLNQVFMNILANGIDMFDEMAQNYSYQELEANPQQITIRTQIESNQVYIRIRDNGKGMSEDVQAKIFDHLFTTKEVGKGTGLGLAIARQIVVEKHGGSLNVCSELGQGTEFCISLPIRS